MLSSRAVNCILGMAGLEIRRIQRVRDDRRTMRGALEHARDQGFAPGTVIDVGAGEGTFPLYEVFPNAKHLLIEPLEEFRPFLEEVASEFPDLEYVIAAAAGGAGQVTLNVHLDLCSSSLYLEQNSPLDGIQRVVPAVALDDICRARDLEGPYLLKVDTEGAELDVLAGASEVVKATEYVLLEVSLFEFHRGGPRFYDVVTFMKGRGFVVYDIVDPGYRPMDLALSQIDIAFVKEDGVFRREHSYATPEQVETLLRQHRIAKALRWGRR